MRPQHNKYLLDMIQESRPTLERLAAWAARDGAHFLEVGSFVGQSTSLFCRQLVKYKNTSMTCVDVWGEVNFGVHDTFRLFTENTRAFSHILTVVREDSRRAHAFLPDGFYDLVYIDGCHFYEAAYQDIKNYRPKCKYIYCGHDCEMRLTDLPSYLFANMSDEWAEFRHGEELFECRFNGVHCGVIRAVHELLRDYCVENRVWFTSLKDVR